MKFQALLQNEIDIPAFVVPMHGHPAAFEMNRRGLPCVGRAAMGYFLRILVHVVPRQFTLDFMASRIFHIAVAVGAPPGARSDGSFHLIAAEHSKARCLAKRGLPQFCETAALRG